MTKLKRPERYVQFESIKPELKEITEFYTRKTADYQYRLKQLNEYVDALENEISVLKETPKVEVLLDNTPKDLPEVPQFVAEYIIRCKSYGSGLIWSIRPDRDANELCRLTYDWLFPNGCRLEDGSFPDPFEPDNLVRPDSNNQLKFIRAWIDCYTVEKEKLYLLKHIDFCKTDKDYDWFMIKFSDGALNHLRVEKGEKPSTIDCKFTKQEIDSMQTGSYEQIEV